MNYFILLGGCEHLDFFTNPDTYRDQQWFWTIPKSAQISDTAFVYLNAPLSRIVGKFTVAAEPFLNLNLFPRWSGKYMCEVAAVEFLPENDNLKIRGLRALFPDWRWWAYPRSNSRIPDQFVQPFLELTAKK